LTETLRTKLRDSGLRLIRGTGGLTLTSRSRWRSRRLLILCYHGFSLHDEHVWNPQIYVTPEHFEARLSFLAKEGYRVVSLREGLRRLGDGSLPARAVAITIDDGTFDFYAVAYPILQRWNAPATIFVATYHVFDQRPVFDVALSYLVWKALTPEPFELEYRGDSPRRSVLVTEANYSSVVAKVRDLSRSEHWSVERKYQWLEQLAERRRIDWAGFRKRRLLALMRPEELADLRRGGVDVQLHTHRHRVPEDRELFLREIRDNRRALVECGIAEAELNHFCYPSGVHRRQFLPWLREAGMEAAVTGSAGLVSSHTHPLLLPRFIDTLRTSDMEFEGWTSGLRHFLRRRSPAFAVDP